MKKKNPSDHGLGFTLTEIVFTITLLSVIFISGFAIFKGALGAWSVSRRQTVIYERARGCLERMAREIRCAYLVSYRKNAGEYPVRFYGTPLDYSLPDARIKKEGASRDGNIGDELFFIAGLPNPGDTDLVKIGYWLRGWDSIDNDGDGQIDEPDEVNVLMRHFEVDNSHGRLPSPPGAPAGAMALFGTAAFDDPTSDPINQFSRPICANVTALQFDYGLYQTLDPVSKMRSDFKWTSGINSGLRYWQSGGNAPIMYDRNARRKIPCGLPDAVRITIRIRDEISGAEKDFSTVVYPPGS